MAKPDYPKTLLEFAAKFHNDDVCLQYLIENRWPEGFVCPTCHHKGGWWLEKHRRFECPQCHSPQEIQGSPQKGHELAPQIHQAFSNLKAWLIGIYHGVEPKYLQSYLKEFVFRFNRRSYPMSAFRSLLEILTSKQPLTLQKLTQP